MEAHIKMDLKEIGQEGTDCIPGLAQGQSAGSYEYGNELTIH